MLKYAGVVFKLSNNISVNINKMNINSIDMFFNINGRMSMGVKDVYFIRYIGFNNGENLSSKITAMELSPKNRGRYFRVSALNQQISPEKSSVLSSIYEDIKNGYDTNLPFVFSNKGLNSLLMENIKAVGELYMDLKQGASQSIIKNFSIKLLFWIGLYFPKIFDKDFDMSISPKFMFFGNIKEQEYLFLYLLARQGCDVMYVNPSGDAKISPSLLKLSSLCLNQNTGQIIIAEYKENSASEPSSAEQPVNTSATRNKINAKHPKREQNKTPNYQNPVYESSPAVQRPPQNTIRQLDYVEIAQMAASVVMISVCDRNNQCFKTGSGVMIGEEGYILTNFHVVSGGSSYMINIENEQTPYYTNEILKYNQNMDLAIIRIDRRCRPIHIFKGESQLVRGQKVVAIGSPLGLFNSVSDGIISGFRTINNVPMIQYTAPTSHGSSGGALLDMYGRLIGLSTAGIDSGQNINLAVDFKTILMFTKGFIK